MKRRVLQCGTMNPPAQEAPGVRVLHKTLDILETIKESPNGVRLSDLARSVELPKATVYRILATLETRGYLDRSEGGSYRVGKKLFEMQRTVPIEQVLARVSQPLLAGLAAECKET